MHIKLIIHSTTYIFIGERCRNRRSKEWEVEYSCAHALWNFSSSWTLNCQEEQESSPLCFFFYSHYWHNISQIVPSYYVSDIIHDIARLAVACKALIPARH